MNKWIKVVAISSLALSLIACGSGSKESSLNMYHSLIIKRKRKDISL